jgi:hypothetical protein
MWLPISNLDVLGTRPLMIKLRVVFVLGAGASIPYGYPSGASLVGGMFNLQSDVVQTIKAHGYTQGQRGLFQEALKKSGHSSIDAFLERRPDFRELGKLLIAAYILRCESEGRLHANEDHWYPMLVDKLDGPFDSLDFSNVTIVTFNYDRSLEQYLFESLCSRHNKLCDQVSNTLSKLRIIHAYGHVGPLDWQVQGGRKYSSTLVPEEVRRAAQGIKIISEGRDDSPELQQAAGLISQANFIFFLGMGYHADNMRRLGLPVENRQERCFTGSGFALTHQEREFIRDRYRVQHVGGDNEQCVRFLRNNAHFLRL